MPVLPPTPSRPINILAIDGGAMMGVIPARLLSYLDGSAYTDPLKGVPAPLSAQPSALSGPLYESFDLIVGTSTGGLLTAGLTVPTLPSSTIMQGNDLLGMYFDNGSYIFPTPSGSLFTCSGPLFTNYGLQDVVNNYWSHPSYAASPSTLDPKFKLEYPWSSADPQTLSQAQASILITSFNGNKQGNPAPSASQPYEGDVNNSVPWGPVLLSNDTLDYQGNPLSAFQACLMTSAFPMLLPPVPYDLKWSERDSASAYTNFFLDGGVFAGNPTLAAYFWALQHGYEIGSLVSLGCGSYATPAVNPTASTAGQMGYPTYSQAAQFGSGTSMIVHQEVPLYPGHPGWLVTCSESYADGTSGDFSTLMSLMIGGPGLFDVQMLSQILSGKYFRLDPMNMPLSDGNGSDDEYYPPYASTTTALEYWVGRTDTLVQSLVSSGAWSSIIQAVGSALVPA